MRYLDFDRLEGFDDAAFRATAPYPWLNPEGVLTDEGYARLIADLPDPARFRRIFGKQRAYGQHSHDRLALEYGPHVELPEPWRELIAELDSRRYLRFIKRMFGRGGLSLSYHWHYTPTGCSVSPHTDAAHKLGSHIFYLNTADNWEPGWGGETLVLDDGGRFDRKSAPSFEDFDREIGSNAIGNRSLLFVQGSTSWHGVREIRCPEGKYRKVFIVVVNDWARALGKQTLDRLRGRAVSRY